MKSSRGMALLWVLMLIGLSLGLAAASLAVSRMTVSTSVVTLERADGLFYAEAAAEVAVSHIRQNSDMHGNLRPGAATRLTGVLPAVDVSMRFEADLSEFNASGERARSVLVRVWPSTAAGEAPRPFVARATLRRDLSVAEWFVLDHEPAAWRAGQHGLPRFGSCSAASPRVTSVAGLSAPNTLQWSLEGGSSTPDEVRVSWKDFRQNRVVSVSAAGGAVEVGVTTPVVASGVARPERVHYRLEFVFEGRVVDACVVEVVSGRAYFSVSPTSICALNDTVQVSWDVNATGVQVVRSQGIFDNRPQVLSTASVGSMVVPVTGGSTQLQLVAPQSVGGNKSVQIWRVC